MIKKEGWIKKRFDEVFDLQMGRTPSRDNKQYWTNGQFKWISIADLKNQKYINSTKECITELAVSESGIKPIPANTVIMSFKLSIGKTAITKECIFSNEAIIAFHLKKGYEIIPEYFYYYLNSYDWGTMNRAVMGQTLNKATISGKRIIIPPIPTQHQIVSELDTLIDIISKKKQQLEELDKLAQATFYDMFGDPVTNEKGWEVKTLQEAVSIDCPISYGIVQPGEEVESGLPIVRPVDLLDTYVSMEKLKRINPELANSYKKTTLRGNEILICVRGTTGVMSLSTSELIGCNVTRGLVPLFFDNHDRLFVYHLLKSPQIQQIISEKTYGIALKQINLSELRKIRLILPPVNVQSLFVKKIEAVHNQKQLISKSIGDVQQLFDYTMDKYFN
jgi:type I restriction enzyme S subunit